MRDAAGWVTWWRRDRAPVRWDGDAPLAERVTWRPGSDGVEWGELYDRQADPEETTNLWDDAGARKRRGELLERLTRAMLANTEESPYPSALA